MQYRLLNTIIRKVELINELKADGQIDLAANYNTQIHVNDENKQQVLARALFEMNGTQQAESTSYLKIELNIDGIFEMKEPVENADAIKGDLHAAMFPYVRAYIATASSLAGLSPIPLPDMSEINE